MTVIEYALMLEYKGAAYEHHGTISSMLMEALSRVLPNDCSGWFIATPSICLLVGELSCGPTTRRVLVMLKFTFSGRGMKLFH